MEKRNLQIEQLDELWIDPFNIDLSINLFEKNIPHFLNFLLNQVLSSKTISFGSQHRKLSGKFTDEQWGDLDYINEQRELYDDEEWKIICETEYISCLTFDIYNTSNKMLNLNYSASKQFTLELTFWDMEEEFHHSEVSITNELLNLIPVKIKERMINNTEKQLTNTLKTSSLKK